MKKSLLLVLLLVALLTGCKDVNNIEENEGSSTTEPNQTATTEAATDYVRTASTVKTDSKTGSIITYQQSFQLDTEITISIYDVKETESKTFDAIFDKIDYYEKMISKTIATSEVSQINEQAGIAPVAVSDEIIEMLDIAIGYAEASGGLFDVTIGPVIELWGIGTDHAAVPSETDLKANMAKVNYKNLEINRENKTVYLKEKGMLLDLGAIAKGYIADQIKTVMLDIGINSGIISLGGNIVTIGEKPNGNAWSIGVRNPEIEESVTELGILTLKDVSIVSSGVYERYFTADNQRYHHIINPFTGYPEQNDIMSITIVSEKSVDGDSLSTTTFLMGLEKGYAYIESLDGIGAVITMKDKSVYVTDYLKDTFILVDNTFTQKEIGQ